MTRNAPRFLGGLQVALVAVILSCLPVPGATAAIEDEYDVTHLYNATHSLTGGCTTSKADPVKDPACLEEPKGALPPEGALQEPAGVTVDAYGNQFVVNRNVSQEPFDSQIDIFDPNGRYIGGFDVKDNFIAGYETFAATSVAVDSEGHLYVAVGVAGGGSSREVIVRYDPVTYDPNEGDIEYGPAPVLIRDPGTQAFAVDPLGDHLYVHFRNRVIEYLPPDGSSPNDVVTEAIGAGVLEWQGSTGSVAVDAPRKRIYVVDEVESEVRVRAFSSEPPYSLLHEIDGSTTPVGNFGVGPYNVHMTLDESTGNLFVYPAVQKQIVELEASGTYVGTIENPPFEQGVVQIAYDNGGNSPNVGYLYVPSGYAQGHLYAYEPIQTPEPPVLESVSFDVVSRRDALLQATINPSGEAGHYRFQLTTEKAFEEDGFSDGTTLVEGEIPATGEGVAVSAVARGLIAGTEYRFRVIAENECQPGGCSVEGQRSFATFPVSAGEGSCPNAALRLGTSARLPDCRVYELVTPAISGGRAPFSPGAGGPRFGTWMASPNGSSVAFEFDGGSLPGFDAAGGYYGDPYVSRRGELGWGTELVGLNGEQAPAQGPGGLSSDHRFAATTADGALSTGGTLVGPGESATYIRYPDGTIHSAEGSIGSDRNFGVGYIAQAGEHILISTTTRLEPVGPADGVSAIYDRTRDGTMHLISLLPGEVTPSADAIYLGTSTDASTVAFELEGGNHLYLRLDNAETVEAAPSDATFAGLSSEGRYLFYLLSGDLYRFDSLEGATERLSEAGDVTPAYVSAQGTSAFFISEQFLAGDPNPQGDEAQVGEPNLYRWKNGQLRFIATVTEEDVGPPTGVRSFSQWLGGINSSGLLLLRATDDGETVLFESRGDLTAFESGGHSQIYLFNAGSSILDCISCSPTLSPPKSDSVLLTEREEALRAGIADAPANAISIVPNLSSDGRRAFFESEERLVPEDEDGLRDVYEWEAQGKGSCAEPGGCIYLISSGKSARPDYLYGASESGDDVFFYTSDLLNGEDAEAAPSIYDARVGGGFAQPVPPAGECLGEACQPTAAAPQDPTPGSSSYAGKGNVAEDAKPRIRRCPKGKRKVRRAGKVRCVPRHRQPAGNADQKRRAHR